MKGENHSRQEKLSFRLALAKRHGTWFSYEKSSEFHLKYETLFLSVITQLNEIVFKNKIKF